jgi:hypothetical protein
VILERRRSRSKSHSRGSEANEKKIVSAAITAIAAKGLRISLKDKKSKQALQFGRSKKGDNLYVEESDHRDCLKAGRAAASNNPCHSLPDRVRKAFFSGFTEPLKTKCGHNNTTIWEN